jgi:hypothetical protein
LLLAPTFTTWKWIKPGKLNTAKLFVISILLVLVYPPIAEVPGLLLGTILEALANRAVAAYEIFWQGIARSLGEFSEKTWTKVGSWFTSAPVWTLSHNGTATQTGDPYPIGKGITYLVLGAFSVHAFGSFLGQLA